MTAEFVSAPREYRARRPCTRCFDRPAKQESDFPPLVAVAWTAEVLQHHVHSIKAAGDPNDAFMGANITNENSIPSRETVLTPD